MNDLTFRSIIMAMKMVLRYSWGIMIVLCTISSSCTRSNQSAEPRGDPAEPRGSADESTEQESTSTGTDGIGSNADDSRPDLSVEIRGVDGPVTGNPDEAIRSHLPAWEACARSGSTAATGALVMDLIISSDGSVRSVRRLNSSFSDETVVSCVLERAGEVRFGPPRGGAAAAVTVALTFGGPAESTASTGLSAALDACSVIVDCDCPADTIVAGRHESDNCCELDCNPGENIVEESTEDGHRYRCVQCSQR